MVNLFLSKSKYPSIKSDFSNIYLDPDCLLDPVKRKKLSNFTAYNARFRMPSPESNGALNMHFSFNYGPVHFISIDTETGYPGASEEVFIYSFIQ